MDVTPQERAMDESGDKRADKVLVANDVPDAWLAAAIVHQGEHLVSFDADFKRLLSRAQFTRLSV